MLDLFGRFLYRLPGADFPSPSKPIWRSVGAQESRMQKCLPLEEATSMSHFICNAGFVFSAVLIARDIMTTVEKMFNQWQQRLPTRVAGWLDLMPCLRELF